MRGVARPRPAARRTRSRNRRAITSNGSRESPAAVSRPTRHAAANRASPVTSARRQSGRRQPIHPCLPTVDILRSSDSLNFAAVFTDRVQAMKTSVAGGGIRCTMTEEARAPRTSRSGRVVSVVAGFMGAIQNFSSLAFAWRPTNAIRRSDISAPDISSKPRPPPRAAAASAESGAAPAVMPTRGKRTGCRTCRT